MGTNFYLESEPCPHCGRSDPPKHIGKSSAGWCFSLRVYPDDGINSLADWLKAWGKSGVSIRDEYGATILPAEMLIRITERSGMQHPLDREDLRINGAMAGPKNLLRHRIDGRYCVGHGDGTYDYMLGDFS